MKILLILLSSLLLSFNLIAGDEYYWAGDKKVNITKDLSTLIVVFKKDRLNLNSINRYESNKEISKATISEDNKMVVLEFLQEQIKSKSELVQTLGLKIDDLEWISYGYKEYEVSLRPTNRISFKLKSNVSEKTLDELIKGKAEFDYTHFGTIMIKVNNVYGDVVSLANEIYESGITEYCLPDFIANIERHEDPLYSAQYFLNHTKQIGIGGVLDSDIDAPEAWDITKGSSSIKVAVIDDGLEAHDDLKDEYGNNKIIGGYTPHGGGAGSPWLSTDGHGEACAGIIAASHNELNSRGVAPGVKLLTVNIFKTGTTNQEIADGINWAWQNGADVLSNSWGFSCNSNGYYVPQIADAINNARINGRNGKGCVVVFSAGNNYPVDKCGYGPSGYVSFPSTVNGVLCVSAINKYGSISSYSSRGSRVDIAAIGGESDIRTLDRMGSNGYNSGNDMNDFGGTSAACPQVSGVAALILSLNPNLTEQQVKDLITQNATDIGSVGKDNLYGWGRIDAAKTLAKLKSQMNSDIKYTEGNASITRTNEGVAIQFLTSPRIDVAAGYYVCDRYVVQTSANGFAEAPLGWFVNSEGYSPDNSNNATGWVNKSITSNSITLQTYFYYIKYNVLGQSINKWAPYDPTGKYIIIGKPLPPLSVSISGPSTAPCATGTWTANVSSGYSPYSYQWYHMYTSGGGELAQLNKSEGGITPNKPIDTWYPVGTNSPTLNYYLCGGNSYLRVDVTDSHNGTATATYYIAGAGGTGGGGELPKSSDASDYNNSPEEYNLEQNSPNPFNPSTKISYSIKTEGKVSLKIYNTLGQEVKTLVDEIKPAGIYEAYFNASELPSGIYIYRMQSGEYVASKKMLLIK